MNKQEIRKLSEAMMVLYENGYWSFALELLVIIRSEIELMQNVEKMGR